MSDLHDMQRRLLDALGLKPEDRVTRIEIDVAPNSFPTVRITRELWTTSDASELCTTVAEYQLTPRKVADADPALAYQVGYAEGQKARVDAEGFERTPVQGEFKIEVALKDAQFKEYKDVRFRNWAAEQLQGSPVNVDWSALTEPEKPKLR